MTGTAHVVRVLPDLTGLDKAFDYAVPEHLAGRVQLGDLVRVELHGRRVRGWVVAVDPPDSVAADRLLDVQRWSSRGPSADLIDLAGWASVRWAAGRLRPFLVSASPDTNVDHVAPPSEPGPAGWGQHRVTTRRIGPTTDPLPAVLQATDRVPSLVLHPSAHAGRALARRLQRAGRTTAVWPDEWGRAASGVDVVVGTRRAAWARLAHLGAVVILDEHDEAYQEERSPTWHARDVLIERARRCGATVTLISPAPTITALVAGGGEALAGGLADERDSWPVVDVVDLSDQPPWKRSLVSAQLVALLRDHTKRVVCVMNTPGRSRRLACRACRAIQRCASCGAGVVQDEDRNLVCRQCQTVRPPVCQACGSTALANIRPGVGHLAEELSVAAGRTVATVTGATGELPDATAFLGTEAVLHRVGRVDAVVFVDLDSELFAPRYRAAEQVLGLLVRAARLVGGRHGAGRIVIQTHDPGNAVIDAVCHVDLARWARHEAAHRAALGLPPFGALAEISGSGHSVFGQVLGVGIDAVDLGDRTIVRAADWMSLGEALLAVPRPSGARLRVVVDPAR